jgi:hypothetical protein
MRILLLILLPLLSFSQIQEKEGNYLAIFSTGGQPPYTYSLNGVSYQSYDTFKCLSPGTYTYYTKDYYSNIKSQSVILYQLLFFSVGSISRNSISVSGLYGKAPYTYSKNSTTRYQSSGNFTSLSSRTSYTIRIKDALGYIATTTITTL